MAFQKEGEKVKPHPIASKNPPTEKCTNFGKLRLRAANFARAQTFPSGAGCDGLSFFRGKISDRTGFCKRSIFSPRCQSKFLFRNFMLTCLRPKLRRMGNFTRKTSLPLVGLNFCLLIYCARFLVRALFSVHAPFVWGNCKALYGGVVVLSLLTKEACRFCYFVLNAWNSWEAVEYVISHHVLAGKRIGI